MMFFMMRNMGGMHGGGADRSERKDSDEHSGGRDRITSSS
jgi:hypothetical protein